MNPAKPTLLTINGGSSSIKFALFRGRRPAPAHAAGRNRPGWIGGCHFARERREKGGQHFAVSDSAESHCGGGRSIGLDRGTRGSDALAAVGHRVVHGGPKYSNPRRIMPDMVQELHQLSPFDPEHLPEEILLIEAFQRRFPDLPQVACFDTAFHHDLPRVARMLPIPRRDEAQGVRHYGFHGLSYAFLMGELVRLAGAEVARGRVILAHLGNGASLAAVCDGKSVDTSMSFTPTAGMPMSTRAGDLDPGLAWYLARTENIGAAVRRDGQFPIGSAWDI